MILIVIATTINIVESVSSSVTTTTTTIIDDTHTMVGTSLTTKTKGDRPEGISVHDSVIQLWNLKNMLRMLRRSTTK